MASPTGSTGVAILRDAYLLTATLQLLHEDQPLAPDGVGESISEAKHALARLLASMRSSETRHSRSGAQPTYLRLVK